MNTWIANLALAAHRADFWSRLCFIGLSTIVAACSAYGFFTEYDVWSGVTVASAGGVALAALCAIAQFCSLNLSHQARRRTGRDRFLCLTLMVVCGCWSAYGLHHFWDVVQLAAHQRAGIEYVSIQSLNDVDGPAATMMAVCVAIAFVEPLTFWVLGGTPPIETASGSNRGNVERISPSRRRAGPRVVAAAAVAALAAGTMMHAVPATFQDTTANSSTLNTRTRDIGLSDIERVADRLYSAGERVSLRRIAAEIGTSKSKIERVLNAASISIADRWPPSRLIAA